MITLDGSQHSGSGTIVRFGLPLAALTGQDLAIVNVRKKRAEPGLRPQHLSAVRAVAEMCGGRVEGAAVGSQEIVFHPGAAFPGGRYVWDIGTAGSTTMLALSVLPIAAFSRAETTIRVTGGLFQDFAPSAFHFQYALLPLLARMGLQAELEMVRPGYVPTGGGVIELGVTPARAGLAPLSLLEPLVDPPVWGIALASHLAQRAVARRMADSCQAVFKRHGLAADLRIENDESAQQPGAALAVFAEGTGALLGADCAGAPRRSAESIGERVASTLLDDIQTGATVDRHLGDQLIIFAALASGVSEFVIPKVTDHVLTNAWLVETLVGAKVHLADRHVVVEAAPPNRLARAYSL